MLEFNDNLFNQRQQRHKPKLKLWRYAGLMLTYRCTAACRFCYYYCAPQAGGLMTTETAIQAWEGLQRIGGDRARVHITGGEPFLCYERLTEIMEQVHRLKLPGPETVETNADWGENAHDIADKLQYLDALGLERLKISWDPFHEEFVEPEMVRRLVDIARRLLGPERVLIRWEHYLDAATGIRGKNETERKRILLDAMRDEPCRFTGRAADALAPLAGRFAAKAFAHRHCRRALLGSKGVHIDPYGNVFNGQCSGMVVGHLAEAPLEAIWTAWQPDREAFWETLYAEGPYGFIQQAQAAGYRVREKYASKCHLCTDIRRFFFDKDHYSPIISPKDCYGKH